MKCQSLFLGGGGGERKKCFKMSSAEIFKCLVRSHNTRLFEVRKELILYN